MDDSITIGADTTEMRRELAAAEEHATQMGGRIGEAFDRGAEGAGRLSEGGERAAHALGHVAEGLLSGGSAAEALSTGLEEVGHAMGLSLGGLAAVAVLSEFIKAIADAKDKAEELKAEVAVLTAGDPTAERNASLDSLNQQLEDVHKKITEIKSEHAMGSLFEKFLDFVSPSRGYERNEEAGALGGTATGLERDIAEQANRQADISETRVTDGEFAAQRKKLEDDYLEKRSQTAKQFGGTEAFDQIQGAADRQYALDQQAIDRKEAAANRQIALESKLAGIKAAGRDVDIESAKARLEAANAELAAATNDDEKNKAGIAVAAANDALNDARRTTAEKREQLATEIAIANAVGTAEQKRRQQLEAEHKDLEDKLANAKPDEALGIQADIAKNEAAQRANMQSIFEKQVAGIRARSQAQTGRGPEEEIAAANREILVLNAELANSVKLYGEQSTEADQIKARIVDQQKRIEDIQFSEKQALAAAKARTLELQLEAAGMAVAAKAAQTRAQFEAQIAAALREGNTELAEQLRQQEQLTLLQQEAAEYLKTPRQRQQEREQQRREKHAEEVVAARDKDAADRAARGAHDQHKTGDAAAPAEETAADSLADKLFHHPAKPPAAPAHPGVSGTATAAMEIKQMTVDTMNVKTLYVESIPCK